MRGRPRSGHQRGGQRRQGRRTGGFSLWSAGKTGTRPGAARRSRNPPALPGHGTATRGKLLARERIELLVDRDSPFLEFSALAAWGTEFNVGAVIVTGVGVVSGVECVIIAHDPTVRGGSMNPWTLKKNLRGARDRQGQPAAADPAGRVGRRRPAHPGRPLHPRGPDLPRPHPALGDADPDDRARVRQLDRRRRVRARHVRLLGDGRRGRQGVPRRAAAREDGDRRGVGRRGARRRARCTPTSPGSPTTSPPTSSTASASAVRSCADLNWRKLGPAPSHAGRRAALTTPTTCSGIALGRPARAVRPARGDRAHRRRLALRRVQGALRHQHRVRVGVDLRLPRRHPRQRARRAVQRGVEEGHRVHPPQQPDRHAARVPPEHDRLHGREGLRGEGDDQGRRQDDQRGRQLHGAALHRDHGRVVRRRELRHVRAAPTTRASCSRGPTRRSR